MDLSRNLGALAIDRVGSSALEELERRVDCNMDKGVSKQQVMNTYLGWLQELVMKGTVAHDSSMFLGSWVQSLTRRGFEKEYINRSFRDWKRREAQADPLTLRRFSIIEQDLQRLFEDQPHGGRSGNNPPNNTENNAGSKLCPPETDCPPSNSNKEYLHRSPGPISGEPDRYLEPHVNYNSLGPQRSGANDLPIGRRRTKPLDCANEIIEIREDSPSEGLVILKAARLSTPANTTPNPDDPDEVMITRETILLDTPPEKMHSRSRYTSVTPCSDFRDEHRHSKGGKFNGPPPNYYICKRCDRGGHWVHHCPTNMDPSMDKPPPETYRCHFCSRTGVHFATLCPLNDHSWSLTQQRRRLGIAGDPDPSERRKDTRRDFSRSGSVDSRGAREPSQAKYSVPDKSRPRFRDDRSRSPVRSSQRMSRERRREKHSRSPIPRSRNQHTEPCRRSPPRSKKMVADSYRPSSHVPKPQKYRPGPPRRDVNDWDHVNSRGRLFYEDDPLSSPFGSPPNISMKEGTPWSPQPGTNASTAAFRAHSNNHGSSAKREHRQSNTALVFLSPLAIRTKPAEEADEVLRKLQSKYMAQADEFLVKLKKEMEEDVIHAECTTVLSKIVDKVCYLEDRGIFEDEHGILYQQVTKPPFSSEVVDLFSRRTNPVVRLRPKRPVAADF